MVDPLIISAISVCWAIVRGITELVDLREKTRDDEAFKYLRDEAVRFLKVVDSKEGLTASGRSGEGYLQTLHSLRILLNDIKQARVAYIDMNAIQRGLSAGRTKEKILALDRRLQGFVSTYLIRAANQTRLDLDAFLHPVPDQPRPLTPDSVRWDVMSHAKAPTSRASMSLASTNRNKIDRWVRSVANAPQEYPAIVPPDDLHSTRDSERHGALLDPPAGLSSAHGTEPAEQNRSAPSRLSPTYTPPANPDSPHSTHNGERRASLFAPPAAFPLAFDIELTRQNQSASPISRAMSSPTNTRTQVGPLTTPTGGGARGYTPTYKSYPPTTKRKEEAPTGGGARGYAPRRPSSHNTSSPASGPTSGDSENQQT